MTATASPYARAGQAVDVTVRGTAACHGQAVVGLTPTLARASVPLRGSSLSPRDFDSHVRPRRRHRRPRVA